MLAAKPRQVREELTKIGSEVHGMFFAEGVRILSLSVLMMCFAFPAWAGSRTATLLPAKTDIIVSLNPRAFLRDHRDTRFVQRYLDQWRLAVKGDEKQLLKYYDTQEILSYEGISRKMFLERAGLIKAAFDALGINTFEDVDCVTFGYASGDKGFIVVVIEGKLKERNTTQIQQFFKEHLIPVNQGDDGPMLGTIDNNTLVYADRKKTLEAIQARAAKKTSALPSGVQTLLESGRKEHLSVVVNNLDTHAQRLMKFIRTELAKSVGIDHPIGSFMVGKGPDLLAKAAADYAAVSLGISIQVDATQLQFGMDARKIRKAEELRRSSKDRQFLGSTGSQGDWRRPHASTGRHCGRPANHPKRDGADGAR